MQSNWLRFILGKPRDPLHAATRRHIALVAFLAWVGLGADGLSSACYGPEQAFLALGKHHFLAFYLVLATTFTIFLIAFTYNQVIELFPNGGGGYKVATTLLGPSAGLISGSALMIDYALTIAISIASGTDALFNILRSDWQSHKLLVEVAVLGFITYLNLRGVKESILLLMPIFVGFFISHLSVILYGFFIYDHSLPAVLTQTVAQTKQVSQLVGIFALLGLFLRAYSLGAGTYTGIEAVSNNVNILAEPRLNTGKWTMAYMAISLSVIAGGILLLYLLWNGHAETGRTLNATVFANILQHVPGAGLWFWILMLFEAGILFVAANTGFLGGPAVMANMAIDSWMPQQFRALSNRLVTQNGVLFFSFLALLLLLSTKGEVAFLIVLYSMNVFLTFTTTFLGLTVHWWRNRTQKYAIWKGILSLFALFISFGILTTTLVEKFQMGGWVTVTITSCAILIGFMIRRHYAKIERLKIKLDQSLKIPLPQPSILPSKLDPHLPTAVFFVKGLGATMHSLLWVLKMFPNYFQNFVFITHGIIDTDSFGSEEKLERLKLETQKVLNYLIEFSHRQGNAATSFCSYGIDPVKDLDQLTQKINYQFSNVLYFATRYIYPNDNLLTRILHSDVAPMIEKKLHASGAKMLILPLKLSI